MVRFPDGKMMGFDRGWMQMSLLRAAEEAGEEGQLLAEHVAATIETYLERDFVGPTVATGKLEEAVKSVLEVIGFPSIAEHFRPLPPPARISLAALARDAGYGYELVFFSLLANRLQEVLGSGTESIELEDLQPCVKSLRAAKHWRSDCRSLQGEIVGFVRDQVSASGTQTPLSIQLS
jgi:hypothetical protein